MSKKIVLLIVAMVVSSAMAFSQNLSYIKRDGSAIADNSTISFSEIKNDKLKALVDLKNNSGGDLNVSFTLTIQEQVGVLGVSCCGFGSCVPVSMADSFSDEATLSAGAVLDFDIYLESFLITDPDNFRIKMEYKVVSGKEEHIVYVVLTSDTTSDITDVLNKKEAYTYQTGNAVNLYFNFGLEANRVLSVYNITGRKVAEMLLSNNYGTVQLPYDQQGIYIYTISENGKNVKSGKYIVR